MLIKDLPCYYAPLCRTNIECMHEKLLQHEGFKKIMLGYSCREIPLEIMRMMDHMICKIIYSECPEVYIPKTIRFIEYAIPNSILTKIIHEMYNIIRGVIY